MEKKNFVFASKIRELSQYSLVKVQLRSKQSQYAIGKWYHFVFLYLVHSVILPCYQLYTAIISNLNNFAIIKPRCYSEGNGGRAMGGGQCAMWNTHLLDVALLVCTCSCSKPHSETKSGPQNRWYLMNFKRSWRSMEYDYVFWEKKQGYMPANRPNLQTLNAFCYWCVKVAPKIFSCNLTVCFQMRQFISN